MKKTALAIAVLLCLFACNYHHDPVETARKDVFRRFPRLGDDSTFVLSRTVRNEHYGFDVLLFHSTARDNRHCFLLLRTERTAAGFPLPDNDEAFWGFDSTLTGNGAFQRELFRAVNALGFPDSSRACHAVLNEIFTSALHCEVVDPADSLSYAAVSSDCGQPVARVCEAHIRRQFERIVKASGAFANEFVLGANWAWIDKSRNRVYLIERRENNWKIGLTGMTISVVRHECPTLCFTL